MLMRHLLASGRSFSPQQHAPSPNYAESDAHSVVSAQSADHDGHRVDPPVGAEQEQEQEQVEGIDNQRIFV